MLQVIPSQPIPAQLKKKINAIQPNFFCNYKIYENTKKETKT